MLAQINNPIIKGNLGNPGQTGGQNIANTISAIINLAIVVGALVFFGMIVVGAIEWISSGGDKQKLESARGRITNALVGVIVLFASFAIVKLIGFFFHIEALSNLTIGLQGLQLP